MNKHKEIYHLENSTEATGILLDMISKYAHKGKLDLTKDEKRLVQTIRFKHMARCEFVDGYKKELKKKPC